MNTVLCLTVLTVLAITREAQSYQKLFPKLQPKHNLEARDEGLFDRIVGGQEASPNQFPWQVALLFTEKAMCGGSYVLDKYGDPAVITAAHCVADMIGVDFPVVFGLHDLRDYWVYSSVNVIYPREVIVHENYNAKTLSNDIAILKFWSSDYQYITSNGAAKPIKLPSRDYSRGETAIASGWGHTQYNGTNSQILKYTTLSLVSLASCEPPENDVKLDDTMLCAYNPGTDTCQNDSGGPLAVYRGEWELVGLTSFGLKGCAETNYPGVYANVYHHLPWINTKLN